MSQQYESVKLGCIYQHYKGAQYRVHAVVRHSESLEQLVMYECLYPNDLGQMWVRPLSMFLQMIDVDGVQTPRFRRLTSANATS